MRLLSRAAFVCFVTVVACGSSDDAQTEKSTPDGGTSSGDASTVSVDPPVDHDAGPERDPDTVGPGDLSGACLRLDTAMPRAHDTHIVSVYQGVNTNGKSWTTVNVVGKDVTLVLASVRALTWGIALAPSATVARVYVEAPSQSIGTTSVVGLSPATPITKRTSTASSSGWSRASNLGGGNFAKQIEAIRQEIGGVETTYQGTYTGLSLTVGSTLPEHDAEIESYDTRAPCADACGRSGSVTEWTSSETPDATISGLSATSSGSASLRTSNGVRCGKHYFEIQAAPPGFAGLVAREDYHSLDYPPEYGVPSTEVAASTRVGVAVDLESKTIVFTSKTGDAAPTTLPAKALDLWYREAVGPAFETRAAGSITLVTRPPFALPVQAGYSTDF